MFSLLVTFRTITIKNDFCYVQTIGITYTYNGGKIQDAINDCLLYTSDAADD